MDKIGSLVQDALNQMEHPFFIKDENRVYRYVNPRAADLASLTPDDYRNLLPQNLKLEV